MRVGMRQAVFLGGTSLLLALLLFMYASQEETAQKTEEILFAEEKFIFSPKVDSHYENPANWTPSYPGTHIQKHQEVIVQGFVNIPFYDLTIDGLLHVELDATIFSPNSQLTVGKTGTLYNDGEVILKHLHQEGLVNNNYSGKLNLHTFQADQSGRTYNLSGGEMIVTQSFTNKGEFNNYGDCRVKFDFDNEADFNQIGDSRLFVKGKLYDRQLARVLP